MAKGIQFFGRQMPNSSSQKCVGDFSPIIVQYVGQYHRIFSASELAHDA